MLGAVTAEDARFFLSILNAVSEAESDVIFLFLNFFSYFREKEKKSFFFGKVDFSSKISTSQTSRH